MEHLLSLKVMRVSRPTLASAWEPFYSSSPSFSAHSTASILSLQGTSPLPGHPKTLRDLSHATQLLTLPASFGAIQLGETFSSCLSVNNDAATEVDGVVLRVEMQTASTKIILGEFGSVETILASGATMECVVAHEIKELGQHVLACTVTYKLPPGARNHPPPASEGANPPGVQSFRKFYKFAVTNPISVKTKVHVPRSPSALLSPAERQKLFLEVYIQNLTQDAIAFERLRLEPVEGWTVEDGNIVLAPASQRNDEDGNLSKESIFAGQRTLMHPQDVRQYIYILTPKMSVPLNVPTAPGSIIPLGRLDIAWRSSFGEPGRLLTSMLSRRIPLPIPPVAPSAHPAGLPAPALAPAPALPPHLHRPTAVPSSATTASSRPGSPVPYRPGSPFRQARASGSISATRSHSPAPSSAGTATTLVAPAISDGPVDLDVNLLVRAIPKTAPVEQPFEIQFTLSISALAPHRPLARQLTLAVQHVAPRRLPNPAIANTNILTGQALTVPGEPFTPRLPSGLSTPTMVASPGAAARPHFNQVLAERLLTASPRQDAQDSAGTTHGPARTEGLLPPPFPAPGEEGRYEKTRNVVLLGPSAVTLDSVRLVAPPPPHRRAASPQKAGVASPRSPQSPPPGQSPSPAPTADPRTTHDWDFSLTFLPLKKGFNSVGGLRVVAVEDRIVSGVDGDAVDAVGEAKVVHEWDVVGEVWVSG